MGSFVRASARLVHVGSGSPYRMRCSLSPESAAKVEEPFCRARLRPVVTSLPAAHKPHHKVEHPLPETSTQPAQDQPTA